MPEAAGSVRSGPRRHGPSPDRVLYAETARERQILPAIEEGLREPGLAAVVGEVTRLSLMPRGASSSRRRRPACRRSCCGAGGRRREGGGGRAQRRHDPLAHRAATFGR